jgi:hypothetical protein
MNDTLTFSNVGTGRHEVLLSGIDGSCTLQSGFSNPRVFVLSSRFAGAQLNYNVFC